MTASISLPKLQGHTAFVFPGQGSQKAGMLAELAEQFSLIRHTFDESSNALGFDVWQIAQSGEQLDQTAYTQPVLLTASIAIWRVWQELGGVKPAVLAGHSLGEYSALVAAGSLSLSDAVKLVHLRGQLMQNAVAEGQGAMAALLGKTDAEVEALCALVSQQTGQVVEAANYNAAGQVVIAGTKDAVMQAIAQAKEQGAKAIVLPVSVPSHCALMQPAAEKLAEALANTCFNAPLIPVVQNVNAQIEADVDSIKTALIQQLYRPVRWTQSMQMLASLGTEYVVECGAGNVLANLAKRLPSVKAAYATDTRTRLEDALSAISLAEGKLA
ncbi:ACP S-malonyltransferase [Alkanindiges illinoisensis]|uniref:Malonyl CoA-acyl carrier protein transacylase n=1 Tax=Alkanindiges illinoisensis TaxID=197183 RepID=A0A4Y7XDT7_9GAMM|nr:ACP S-malonyltransferase [Alkanindiges illinoisensis]TEU29375.1 ACP S-malonyltransferase [Alkanindiges illinoisensis]